MKKRNFVYSNKKGELFPYDEKDGLQGCCDRYNEKLNECYAFIEMATNNPMSPVQRTLTGEYYTSSFYKEFFGRWCEIKSSLVKKSRREAEK